MPQHSTDPEDESLDALKTRIEQAQKAQMPDEPSSRRASGAGEAMRVASELLGGVVVGSVIGVLLDRWLGTTPWLFIVCFFFGVAGSGLTIYRSTQRRDE